MESVQIAQEARDIYSVIPHHADSPLSHLQILFLPGDPFLARIPQCEEKFVHHALWAAGVHQCSSTDPHQGDDQPGSSLACRVWLRPWWVGGGEEAAAQTFTPFLLPPPPPPGETSSLPNKNGAGTSLVAQWLRIRLPMQGTQVRGLLREDPTCRGATKPVHHSY